MRSTSSWRRLWSIWTATAVGSGVVLDTAAYVFVGHDATLTASVRRWTHLEPVGKRARLGRVGLVAFFAWCIAHLGWGLWDPLPRSWAPLFPGRDVPKPRLVSTDEYRREAS